MLWAVLRSAVALCVLHCGPRFATAASSSTEPAEYVLVAMPYEESVAPLAAVGAELVRRGHRVAFAAPEPWSSRASASVPGMEAWVVDKALSAKAAEGGAPFANVTQCSVGAAQAGSQGAALRDVAAQLHSFVRWQGAYYVTLMKGLVADDGYAEDPPFVVADRFAFGAFHACDAAGLGYAVHNPAPLLDLDAPPLYVTPPFYADVPTPPAAPGHGSGVWARAAAFHHRVRYRLAAHEVLRGVEAFRHDIATMFPAAFGRFPRAPGVGLSELGGTANATAAAAFARSRPLDGRLVLSGSVFGVEEPRPLGPLVNLVGPMYGLGAAAADDGAAGEASRLPAPLADWLAGGASAARPGGGHAPVVLVDLGAGTHLASAGAKALLEGIAEAGARQLWIVPDDASRAVARDLARALGLVVDGGAVSNNNARIVTTAPRPALFAHPLLKVAVTCGDFQATQRWTAATGAPAVMLPRTPLQREGAHLLARAGAGVVVEWAALDAAGLAAVLRPRLAPDDESQPHRAAAQRVGWWLGDAGGAALAAILVEDAKRLGTAALDDAAVYRARRWYSAHVPLDVYAVFALVLAAGALVCSSVAGAVRRGWASFGLSGSAARGAAMSAPAN